MKEILQLLRKYKYSVALVSVFNFLLTPVHIGLLPSFASEVVVINYSIVIFAGAFIASNGKTKIPSYLLGIATLLLIWCEFANPDHTLVLALRLVGSFLLFSYFFMLLIAQLRTIKGISLQFIIGPILGFVYLGVIGGILFEALQMIAPTSFGLTGRFSGYIFYYFSFISITTVGYGDVAPVTGPAQSITLIMNIIGQFYLAIVIAVFVGKYNSIKS